MISIYLSTFTLYLFNKFHMKYKLTQLFFISCIFTLFISCEDSKYTKKILEKSPEIAQEPIKKLRHVVLFKFKETVTKDSITYVEKAFSELPLKISEIVDFEWGTDISVEELHNGFTHSFLVTFSSEEGRDNYLPHAEHQKFVKMVTPLLDDVLVIDYWAK